MGSYRLYLLRAAELAGSDEIEAKSDAEAARLAHARALDHRVEVWRGDRRIRTMGPLRQPMS